MKNIIKRTLAGLGMGLATFGAAGQSTQGEECWVSASNAPEFSQCTVADASYWMPEKLVITLKNSCQSKIMLNTCVKAYDAIGGWDCEAVDLKQDETWNQTVNNEQVWYKWAWVGVDSQNQGQCLQPADLEVVL